MGLRGLDPGSRALSHALLDEKAVGRFRGPPGLLELGPHHETAVSAVSLCSWASWI